MRISDWNSDVGSSDLDGIELFPARLALGERHVHRGPDRARDLSAIVRVNEQRIGELLGRAREAREDEYARIFGILRRDIFLGDEVHPVAKRGDRKSTRLNSSH